MDLGTCADLAPQCAPKFCINPCGLGGKAPTTSAAMGSSGRSRGSAHVDLSNLGA